MAADTKELEDLQKEIQRLNLALDEASNEKIQAAQYGLQVLEEKQQVQAKCIELEAVYEATKHELDCAKEALDQFQTLHKVATNTDIQHSESLLEESATREAELTHHVGTVEHELKHAQQELSRTKSELEKLQSMHQESSQTMEGLDAQKKSLRDDLKETKLREQRLLNDYSELEEENISLQKTVSSLKSGQIEYESLKHEVKRLVEDTEVLQAQTEEANKLKGIAERQVEEALLSLQQEREQREHLQKTFLSQNFCLYVKEC